MSDPRGSDAKAALLKLEDDIWLKSVFNLIPKTIYSGGSHNALALVDKEIGNKSRGKKKQKKKSASTLENDGPERKGLREKLHKKINEKRVARKADDETRIAIRAHKKRKREEKDAEKEKDVKRLRRHQKFEELKQQKKQKKRDRQQADPEADKMKTDGREEEKKVARDGDGGLETARIVGFSEEKEKKNKARRGKLSGDKLKELQKKLAQATKEKELKEKAGEEVSTGKRDGEKEGVLEEVMDREMDKALQRVQGGEVRDDVKRLKKSIRREKRKSEKSKEEWAQRVEAVEKEKAAKQERRVKNLKERNENKGKGSHSKPKKKISKRRKK